VSHLKRPFRFERVLRSYFAGSFRGRCRRCRCACRRRRACFSSRSRSSSNISRWSRCCSADSHTSRRRRRCADSRRHGSRLNGDRRRSGSSACLAGSACINHFQLLRESSHQNVHQHNKTHRCVIKSSFTKCQLDTDWFLSERRQNGLRRIGLSTSRLHANIPTVTRRAHSRSWSSNCSATCPPTRPGSSRATRSKHAAHFDGVV
jgi:hypothetical protein